MSTRRTPTAEGKSCQLGGRKIVLPSTSAAPSTAPSADPRPPTAVEVNTTRLTGTRNGVSTYDWLTTRSRQPTTGAPAAEAAPANRRARLRSQCQSSTATAPTVAPTAAKDIWPRLTWPDQPVSTTIEQPTMASTTSDEARMSAPGPSQSGSVQAA